MDRAATAASALSGVISAIFALNNVDLTDCQGGRQYAPRGQRTLGVAAPPMPNNPPSLVSQNWCCGSRIVAFGWAPWLCTSLFGLALSVLIALHAPAWVGFPVIALIHFPLGLLAIGSWIGILGASTLRFVRHLKSAFNGVSVS
jgi:hypothetical protein